MFHCLNLYSTRFVCHIPVKPHLIVNVLVGRNLTKFLVNPVLLTRFTLSTAIYTPNGNLFSKEVKLTKILVDIG
jgi:hypothetical protein